MSAAVNSSAAVTFRSPQDVEVLVDGTWVPGAMHGWRHDATGGCEARVRLRDTAGADGEDAWVDLALVRLPERHLTLASGPADGIADPTGTAALPAVARRAVVPGARAPRRGARRHGGDVTAEQPAVRPAAAGRHRAPAGSGRHRAATAEMPVVICPVPADGAVAEEPDMLTRPIRLGDLVPHPRGGRPAVRPTA
ncbi:hypothetical protein ACI8AA_16025 [Geodermatophilus sp. SYSU D01180]